MSTECLLIGGPLAGRKMQFNEDASAASFTVGGETVDYQRAACVVYGERVSVFVAEGVRSDAILAAVLEDAGLTKAN